MTIEATRAPVVPPTINLDVNDGHFMLMGGKLQNQRRVSKTRTASWQKVVPLGQTPRDTANQVSGVVKKLRMENIFSV